jgi:hypothetical protein
MILQSMAIMNMDGEGIGDIKDFFRKKLVQLGVVQPTEEEQQAMMEAMMAGQQPDPQSMYLMAAAQEAQAKAVQAQANTEYSLARAEETRAKTAETLSNIDIDQRKSAIETAEKIGVALQPQMNVVPPTTQFG